MQTQTDLMEKLAAPENLLTAWRAVRGNIPRHRRQRSAGPDGVTLSDFERDLPVQLSTLRHMLLKGRYQPQKPGLFTIRKADGGSRQIALLNVADRVTQRAAQQVIEPLYEPGFLPCSFGFRPGRSIEDAVYCARQLRKHGYSWVVDGDIAACFDTLDHRLLIGQVNKKIGDARVLELLRQWLAIGILQHGLPNQHTNWLLQGWQKTTHGVRQGVDWALDAFAQSEPTYEPYPTQRPDPGPIASQVEVNSPNRDEEDALEDDDRFYHPNGEEEIERRIQQRRAIQQMAAGGLMMGSGWARRAIAKAGPAALAALKSPIGREAIKRGLLVGGGALGAAVGVAASGYFLYQKVAPKPVGVMQGSPLSPLLANIYLHTFDLTLTRSGYRLVRYADDWVILCADQDTAEAAYNRATLALAKIRLKINPAKTRILTPTERLEWLGVVVE
ncbi:MAG TPA: reverse transcriptase domain-containing protein [Anaerolineales bacterium]|nr:reverse transcriptase domain-containing protein [Anaerolineales bacterium]